MDAECQSKFCKYKRCDMPVEKSFLTQMVDMALKVVAVLILFVAVCFWIKSRREAEKLTYSPKKKTRERIHDPDSNSREEQR